MPTIITSDSILKKKYSASNINIANATGTLDLIFELVQLKKLYATKATPETQISIMIKKQEIANRLIVCRTEIAGIAAELDCEGERAAQLSSYMSDKQLSKINKLTVASITVGALSAVIAVFIHPQSLSNAIAITGGLGSAALGLMTLSISDKTEYKHPRNLLKDIWYEPKTSKLFPIAIWYILTHKEFSNNRKHTICFDIRGRWEEYNELKDDGSKDTSKKIKLLFGSGGTYTSGLLATRSNMLNQVQASIKLLDQDIQQLLYAVNK
jgi:hypothetical protein